LVHQDAKNLISRFSLAYLLGQERKAALWDCYIDCVLSEKLQNFLELIVIPYKERLRLNVDRTIGLDINWNFVSILKAHLCQTILTYI
jgi:hypothetical protein